MFFEWQVHFQRDKLHVPKHIFSCNLRNLRIRREVLTNWRKINSSFSPTSGGSYKYIFNVCNKQQFSPSRFFETSNVNHTDFLETFHQRYYFHWEIFLLLAFQKATFAERGGDHLDNACLKLTGAINYIYLTALSKPSFFSDTFVLSPPAVKII